MRAFVSVYEEGSFSAAAARENATQSGLSMQIRNLEERLGLRLFERGPQGVTPTPAGRVYYSRCLPILNAARSAEEEVQALAGDISGKLRMGVIPSLSRGGLANVLIDFTQRYPNVDLHIFEGYIQAVTDGVLDGSLDFAVVPQHTPQVGLESRLIARDHEILVCGPKLGLAPRQPVRLAELPPLKLVLPALFNSRRATLEQYFHTEGVRIQQVMELDGILATFWLVAQSDWATIQPMTAMIGEVRREHHIPERMQINPIVRPSIPYAYMLIRRTQHPLSPQARLFSDALEAELARNTAEWDTLVPSDLLGSDE